MVKKWFLDLSGLCVMLALLLMVGGVTEKSYSGAAIAMMLLAIFLRMSKRPEEVRLSILTANTIRNMIEISESEEQQKAVDELNAAIEKAIKRSV